ncbi:MAG: hypothetical protein WD601_04975 [Pseudohongiellaceae bacterium]
MGITSWFPRYILPGAKPSVACRWPESLQPEPGPKPESPSPAPASAKIDTGQSRAHTDAIRNSLKEIKSETRQAATVQGTAASAQPQAPIRFKLVMVRLNEAVCLINQLPHVGGDGLSAVHLRLLRNICHSLSLPLDGDLQEQSGFSWPLTEGMDLAHNTEAAREALHAFVDHKLSDKPCRALLIMGESLQSWLLAGQPGTLENYPGRILVTGSLDQMLRVPAATKPDVWRQLRTLRKTIDGS